MTELNHKHNPSIGCDVSECEYHCDTDDYCTLNQIEVSRDGGTTAHAPAATECASFKESGK